MFYSFRLIVINSFESSFCNTLLIMTLFAENLIQLLQDFSYYSNVKIEMFFIRIYL